MQLIRESSTRQLEYRLLRASGSELLQIVCEYIIIYLDEAKHALLDENIDIVERKNDKIRDLLAHLISTLEGSDEDCLRQKSLYVYINELITDAKINDDYSNYDIAIELIKPIKEAWQALSQKEKN
ncbi:MAG: flagellar protein FliS [Peptostreptococcaceae bacterium]|jgi:flagellin-specific chaperone FliS|nr:flagellar protein FliS [Peptostreptococcaceae bacterium]